MVIVNEEEEDAKGFEVMRLWMMDDLSGEMATHLYICV